MDILQQQAHALTSIRQDGLLHNGCRGRRQRHGYESKGREADVCGGGFPLRDIMIQRTKPPGLRKNVGTSRTQQTTHQTTKKNNAR
jgi:hypothetical protein